MACAYNEDHASRHTMTLTRYLARSGYCALGWALEEVAAGVFEDAWINDEHAVY